MGRPSRCARPVKYIPVWRLALFVEHTLYRGFKWVVFGAERRTAMLVVCAPLKPAEFVLLKIPPMAYRRTAGRALQREAGGASSNTRVPGRTE
jgi:hypothetical protein